MNSMGSMSSAPAANWSMMSAPVRPMGMMQQQPMMSAPMMMSTPSFNQPLLGQQNKGTAKQLTAAEMQDLLS
jgi:hypothetical protein